MFHVERDPVQVAAALLGSPGDEVVHIGVNNL